MWNLHPFLHTATRLESIPPLFAYQGAAILTRHTLDPFAEADEEDSGQTKQTQEYIHIRIQRTCHSAVIPDDTYVVAIDRILTLPCRAQWPQDLDYCPGYSQEIRCQEDPKGRQEGLWYVLDVHLISTFISDHH